MLRIHRYLMLVIMLAIACQLSAKKHTQQHTKSIGQSFIMTLPETEDRAKLASWLAATKPAGVMLLAYHMQDRDKTRACNKFLQTEAAKLGLDKLIIATDWEGGIVSRPSEAGGYHSIPSPWALARMGTQACFQAGVLIGQQMRDVGITMDFAPSLDLFNTHILATRCFSADAEVTAQSGIAFAQGLMAAGITPVIKHYPGLGLGSADTHEASVAIALSASELARQEQPFLDALSVGLPAVMATHASYAALDPENPCTRSPIIVQRLRARNPKLLLITDDFCMTAAFEGMSRAEALRKALAAGYDLAILSAKPEEQISMLRELNTAGLHSMRSHTSKLRSGQNTGALVGTNIDEPAMAKHLAQTYLQQLDVPELKNKDVYLITVDLPVIRPPERWFINCKANQSFLGAELERLGCQIRDEFILHPKQESSLEQLDTIIALFKKYRDTTIIIQTLFYANDIWNKIERAWLEKLAPFASRLIMVSLGHPEEIKIVPQACMVPLGSFQEPLLTALATRLVAFPILGADVVAEQPEKYLLGKRFGLLCNQASRCSDGRFLPDVVSAWASEQEDKTKLVALFSPEHGLKGNKEAFARVDDETTSAWNCPVYSLHGSHRKPSAAMLKNIDLMVIDLPSVVGARYFTYFSTLKLTLEACQEAGIPAIVLDRPNLLERWGEQGPELDPAYMSFVGKIPTRMLHGKTMGGIARLLDPDIQILPEIKGQKTKIGIGLEVGPEMGSNMGLVASSETGFGVVGELWAARYTAPSPNLTTPDHVYAYPLTVLFEGTNYSEGRGVSTVRGGPFLTLGAPWVNEQQLAAALNAQKLPGLYFQPITFTPRAIPGVADNPKHKDKLCRGVFVHIIDHAKLQHVISAKVIITTLFRLYPVQSRCIKWGHQYGLDLLWGNSNLRKALESTDALL